MVMKRSLPDYFLRRSFMDLTGNPGLIQSDYLIQRRIISIIVITADHNNHMDVIWHYNKFIYMNP